MHTEQKQYCESIKQRFPEYFQNKTVLDVGSLDINGTNMYLFNNCHYTGLDIGPGPNVDIICPIHEFKPTQKPDVIISTEMLEHDKHRFYSLANMVRILKPGGLLLITAATVGRKEHGTNKHEPHSSPYTNDYYKPVKPDCLLIGLPWYHFNLYEISVQLEPIADIRFCGIKK